MISGRFRTIGVCRGCDAHGRATLGPHSLPIFSVAPPQPVRPGLTNAQAIQNLSGNSFSGYVCFSLRNGLVTLG